MSTKNSAGPHIPPALMRRIEALGFTPGSGEPVGWLLGYVESMAALLTTARKERDELAATLANERGEGAPPEPGWTARRRGGEARWVLHNERPGRVLDVVRQMGEAPRTIVSHWWDREVNADGTVVATHAEGEAETMRAAMRAAHAARVATPSPDIRR